MQIRNFLFHRVSPEVDRLWHPMSPAHFERIIKYMVKHYDVVLLEDQILKPAKSSSKKPVATVLFDDGYKDNIEHAAPILKKYDCPASFYVVTDCIDRNVPTWTYIFDYQFQNTLKSNLNLPMEVDGISSIANWMTSDERLQYAKALKPKLKRLSHGKRSEILSSINKQFDDVKIPKIMMSWDDVRSLKSDGFHISSHSKTHTLLATIEGEKELEDELILSKETLMRELGEKPVTISYPIGSYDARVMKKSKETGYKIGLAVDERFYDTEADDIFSIPRVELYEESWFRTRMRMTGAIPKIKQLIR